jgi:hypothetical protein
MFEVSRRQTVFKRDFVVHLFSFVMILALRIFDVKTLP